MARRTNTSPPRLRGPRLWGHAALAATLSLLLVPAVGHGRAPDSDDAVHGLIHELRSMNRNLRLARLNFERYSRMSREDAVEALNNAQVAFFQEDYLTAALRLTELTGQDSFKDHPGYGEALTYLAESLWQLGLEAASVARFEEALQQRGLPTAYRHTLSRYLTVAGDSISMASVEQFWSRYLSMRTEEALEPEDRDIRYQYAKTLFKGGRLAGALSIFEQIGADEADVYNLKALYFTGVIHLKRGHQLKALEAFMATREAYEVLTDRPVAPLPEPMTIDALEKEGMAFKGAETLEVIPLEGAPDIKGSPERRFEEEMAALAAQEGVDEETVIQQERDHVGQLTYLALARLHAARDEYQKSWYHYRKVLVLGSPEETAALSEASFVLSKRGAFDWSRRLVDRQLRRRAEDLSSAKLRLWRAQLMAQAARYDVARDDYEKMEAALQRRADQLAADLGSDPRMFPEALLAWSAPEDASYMRTLEADLTVQGIDLEEIQDLIGQIGKLSKHEGALPSVARGREIHEALVAQLDRFEKRLKEAEASARSGDARSGVPAGRLTAAAPEGTPAYPELRRSTRTLRARLDRFSTALTRYERQYRQRIASTLSEEQPRIDRLSRDLKIQRASANSLAGDLRSVARQNLDQYVAEAQFGQVNLAWWRKWEISQRIQRANQEVQDLDAQMREAMTD